LAATSTACDGGGGSAASPLSFSTLSSGSSSLVLSSTVVMTSSTFLQLVTSTFLVTTSTFLVTTSTFCSVTSSLFGAASLSLGSSSSPSFFFSFSSSALSPFTSPISLNSPSVDISCFFIFLDFLTMPSSIML
ncbi:unnamed protein product, partial [Ixodes persulcatus]